jgi:hypothetical protein
VFSAAQAPSEPRLVCGPLAWPRVLDPSGWVSYYNYFIGFWPQGGVLNGHRRLGRTVESRSDPAWRSGSEVSAKLVKFWLDF